MKIDETNPEDLNWQGILCYILNDYQEAFEWFEKAAKLGYARAQNKLGRMYEDGEGVKQDYQKAFEWYEKAVNQGDVESLFNLGYLYDEGLGVEKNYEKALEYYEKAAKLGHAGAQNNLGYMYEKGKGTKQDYQEAFEWFEKAAKQGRASAQYNLGRMYEKGKGTKQDYQKAFEWYEKAANQGNANAQNKLGLMYEEGKGTKQDYQKAFEWYEKAANQGNAAAQYNLGFMYYTGTGTEINRSKSLEMFEKSKHDNEDSNRIVYTHKYIDGEQIDFAELFKLNEEKHRGDSYFKKIKRRIDIGHKVFYVESIMDLAPEQKNKEVRNIDDIINSILATLSKLDKDDIINIKAGKSIFSTPCSEFYTVSEFKKILKVIYKLLKNIDLNQNEADKFMQIYIKLGMMLHYDDDAINQYEKLRKSTSRNLMIFLKRKGLCTGYAAALKTLCNVAGIKCIVLSSKKDSNNEAHAINQVMINGKWYYVDLTWDCENLKRDKPLKNCLQSKEAFTHTIYHQTIDIDYEQEAPEDYKNVEELKRRNIEILKKTNNNSLTEEQTQEKRGKSR